MNTSYTDDEVLYGMNLSAALGLNFTSDDDMMKFYKLSGTEKICGILVVILIVPVIIIGVFGNLTVCWVVATVKKLQTPANIQLVMLAVVDFANCIIPAPTLLFRAVYVLVHANALSVDDTIYNVTSTPICHILRFIQYLALETSACMLTSLTITRAMGMSGKFSREIIKKCIIVSLIASTLFGSGVSFGLVMSTYFCESIIEDVPFRNKLSKQLELVVIASMVISQITTTVVYIGITICKKRHRNATKEIFKDVSKSLDKRDMATIRICFLLITFIFVSYLPIIVVLAFKQSDSIGDKIPFLYAWVQIAIVFANSAINPVVYALMSDNFRSNLCFVRRRRLQKKPQPQKATRSQSTSKILDHIKLSVISNGQSSDDIINLDIDQVCQSAGDIKLGDVNIDFECD
ncbi:uncharacterized protein LOC144449263 [Glandiceps talaboti]